MLLFGVKGERVVLMLNAIELCGAVGNHVCIMCMLAGSDQLFHLNLCHS